MVRPETYREVRIEDVDRAIHRWFDVTVDAHVDLPGGRRHKVPVVIANRERWASAREDIAHRDKDGRIVLPTILISRTSLDPSNGMLALGSNVPTLQISRRIAEKTQFLAQNNRDRLLSRVEPPVVYEVVTIPFPFNGTAVYELDIQTQYVEHTNSIVERIMAELEFFDVPSFVAPIWGDNLPGGVGPGPGELESEEHAQFEEREMTSSYYVCGYFDGPLSPDNDQKDSTGQERVLGVQGSFTVPVFLQLDPKDKRAAVQVERTAFRVGFGSETSHFPETDEELELLLSNGRISEKVRRR